MSCRVGQLSASWRAPTSAAEALPGLPQNSVWRSRRPDDGYSTPASNFERAAGRVPAPAQHRLTRSSTGIGTARASPPLPRRWTSVPTRFGTASSRLANRSDRGRAGPDDSRLHLVPRQATFRRIPDRTLCRHSDLRLVGVHVGAPTRAIPCRSLAATNRATGAVRPDPSTDVVSF